MMKTKILHRFLLSVCISIFVNILYSQTPTISGFSPSSGSVGTLVTITGTGLDNPTSFTIAGVNAIVISNTGTKLVGMVMPGATTGNISVITAGGTAASAGNFTVIATNYPSIQQGDKLVDTNTNVNGSQGAAVAISADGNTAVVGDFNYNNNIGCARIYIRNGSVWTQEQILTVPVTARIWTLGWAVAISADRNTVVVDGWEMDSAYTDVLVFTRSNSIWSQQGDLKVQGALHHGCPLAISADGNTILCASLGNVNNSPYSTCEVFSRNNNVWTHQTSLNNINAAWNIVLSADGNTAIMGAWGNPEGIYVFTRSGNLWTQQNNILPPPNAIGFGYSTAISADGNTIMVGAPFTPSGSNPSFSGAMFFYTRSGNSWIQQGTGIFADSSANSFGENTELSADGNIAMVEGQLLDSNHIQTGQKAEWIYKRNNGVWALLERKISVKGNGDITYKSLALSADGNTAVIGVAADGVGGAWIYVADSSLNGGNVNGGGGGGLESKDLGDAIVKRVYNKAFNNLNGSVDYNKLTIVGSGRTAGPTTFGLGGIASVTLAGIMPDITNSGYVAYNSTPLDITSITNAAEVIATDFTINQEPKAVAFATKTLGALYDHTKPICDRLKGASLLNIAPIKVGGYDFVQYTLKDENGVTEYATSFSIGTKSGRNNFSVQSTWLLKDYISEDVMYNFQLWASTPQLVNAMITDVLNKVKAVAPVVSISSINIPATYIVSGNRTGTNLNLVLTNGTANTSGYFTLQDQSTELSTSTASRQIPFTLNANGQSTVSIPMNDLYESTISMYVNGAMTDVVYMADGAWTVDYNKATTSVSSFTVKNDAGRVYDTTAYSLLRNATVTGNSSDYVSVIKLLRGGGAAADLTAYKTLQLTASGGNTLRVTLVKNSITNWADQYYTEIKLDDNQKDYYLSLNNFISTASKDKIKADDVTTVVFAIEVGTATNTAINTTLSNISFAKQDANYLNNLNSKDIQLYPNPATAKNFTCSFYSNADAQELTLKVTDVMGRTIATQQVNAIKGLNIVPVNLNSNTTGMHIISLDGNGVKYNSKKIVLSH